MSKVLDGIKFGFGFILIIGFIFGIVFAVGFHSANEILGGTFSGNFEFDGDVNLSSGDLYFQDGSKMNSSSGIDGIPSGAQIYFSMDSCPLGYSPAGTGNAGKLVGAPFGNMVRFSTCFDGDLDQTYNQGAYGTSQYAGLDWGVPKIVSRYIAYSSNDYGFGNYANGGDQTQTIILEGSNDNSNWVQLHTDSFPQQSSPAFMTKEYTTGIDISNAYRYHRVTFTSANSNSKVAEIEFYEKSIFCEKN